MEVYFGLLLGVSVLTLYLNLLPKRIYFSNIGKTRLVNRSTISFILIFGSLAFFSAIRDGIGSDYYSYIRHIELIQAGQDHYMEIGFQKVVLLLGYFDNNPRLVLIVFSILTCFFYVKAIYDYSSDVFISLFIFLSWGYYFFTFTTVRNYFALSLILFAIKYFLDGRNVRFVVIALIATLFHKSALICLPIYYLAKRKWSIKYLLLTGVVVICIFFVFKNPIRTLMFMIYPQYEGSAYDTGEISYLNIIKAMVTIILCLVWKKEIIINDKSRFFFNLNVFSLIFYIGMYWAPEASRIGFYMNATSIFLIPCVISSVKDRRTRIVLKIALCIFSLILFYLLCKGFASSSIRLLPYKTWLFDGTY